jgi:transglutaminase-like putative cysteine protease
MFTMNRIIGILIFAGIAGVVFSQSEITPPPAISFPYEPSNAVVRFDCTYVNLKADGTSETLKHYRVALLTDRAIRQYAQDVTVYNLGYDTVEVISALVHLPSGEIVEVDTSAIKDVPMPAYDRFYLENVREKIITFPELTKGAEIEVRYKEITREPPMDGEFNLTDYLAHTDPIQDKYIQIDAPEDMELKWKVRSGEAQYLRTVNNGIASHVWTTSNVPQIVPEPGMPPIPEVTPELLVSTIKDWETWSRWYYNLSEPETVADDEICRQVAELTAGKSREEAIRAIFYFVSNKIRYVDTALTGKKAGYKPESAPVTLRNKYGVCRDKAALMVSMLREAGVESNIVLMNPVWKIDQDIPADQFNHAIVAVRDGDQVTYIDPTVEKTVEYLAANEQDRGVLMCTKEGTNLDWTAIEPPENNLYEIKAKSKLDENGLLKSNLTISTKGLPDLILRSHLQSMPPEEREMMFKQLIQGISPKAMLDSIEFSDLLDFSVPVTIKLSFMAEDFSIPAGEYLLFQVPGQSGGLDFVSHW